MVRAKYNNYTQAISDAVRNYQNNWLFILQLDSDKMATLNIGTLSHHYIEEKEGR